MLDTAVQILDKPELELTLGAPAHFPLYTSTVRDDTPGEVLRVAAEQLLPLVHDDLDNLFPIVVPPNIREMNSNLRPSKSIAVRQN